MKLLYTTVQELIEYLIIKMLPYSSVVRYIYYVNNGTSNLNSQFEYLLERQEFFKLQII